MADPRRTQLTYRYERWRAVASGVLETAATTFLILIAVRWFEAGSLAKALVAGGGSVGLLLSPWIVSRVESLGWPTAVAASRLACLGAASFLLTGLFPVLPVFVAGCVVAMAASSAAIPLMTQVYQDNYPEPGRGRLFSKTIMIRIAAAAIFSELAGRLLSGNLEWFRALLFFFALMFGVAAVCLGRCPSQPLHVSGGTHPFRALRYARTDRLFRQTLVAWMLMGFANLMMLPLRVEYLANPKYEMTLTVWWIALLTGVLPNLARLCLSPIWGWLFDHMNFFALRITLNIGFALGILAFFTSNAVPGLILGALIYGASSSGGDVAWSLWVTKFSPPNRVADYMSVHTFFTGVRGLLAPLAGFHLATFLPLPVLAWFCIGLILLATLLLIPEIKFGNKARTTSALVKEVSDS